MQNQMMIIQKHEERKQQLKKTEIKFECEQLQLLKLSEVFQQVKKLINSISKNSILAETDSYSKKRLHLISQFVIRKLKSKVYIEPKKFVGYISLLSLLFLSNQKQQNSLNFPTSFYRNVSKYTEILVDYWLNSQNKENQQENKKTMAVFLYSLSSFCQRSQEIKGLKVQKLISLKVIKNLLRLQVYDDERIMRHYRILMMYIFEKNHKNLSNSLFFKSLFYHFLTCTTNRNTQSALIFIFNRMFKNKKLGDQLNLLYDLKPLASRVKQIILRQNTPIQVSRLAFSLFSKLLQINRKITGNLISAQNLIFIIEKFYGGFQNTIKINMPIYAIIEQLSKEDSYHIYLQFVTKGNTNNTLFEVIQFLTRKTNQLILLHLINSKMFSYLLQCYFKQKTYMFYSNSWAIRIIDNITNASHEINEEMSQIIKRLTILNINKQSGIQSTFLLS